MVELNVWESWWREGVFLTEWARNRDVRSLCCGVVVVVTGLADAIPSRKSSRMLLSPSEVASRVVSRSRMMLAKNDRQVTDKTGVCDVLVEEVIAMGRLYVFTKSAVKQCSGLLRNKSPKASLASHSRQKEERTLHFFFFLRPRLSCFSFA